MLKLQLKAEGNYYQTLENNDAARNASSAQSGAIASRDGETGQYQVQLADGGIVRASTLSPRAYPEGAAVPSLVMGPLSGVMDN